MKEIPSDYRKLVLVCQNDRDQGRDCCMRRCDAEFYPTLKAKIKETYTDVRVSKAGCLGACSTGTTVVIMPDNIWLGEVGMEDIPEILKRVS